MSWALILEEKEISLYLFQKGAKGDTRDHLGITPMAWASLTGAESIYAEYRDRGLFLTPEDKGWAAVQVAEKLNEKQIQALLLDGKLPEAVSVQADTDKMEKIVFGGKEKFLTLAYDKQTIRIDTQDELRRKFTLTAPDRLVLDFTGKGPSKSFIQTLKEGNAIQKVVIGRHEGYYRVVR